MSDSRLPDLVKAQRQDATEATASQQDNHQSASPSLPTQPKWSAAAHSHAGKSAFMTVSEAAAPSPTTTTRTTHGCPSPFEAGPAATVANVGGSGGWAGTNHALLWRLGFDAPVPPGERHGSEAFFG